MGIKNFCSKSCRHIKRNNNQSNLIKEIIQIKKHQSQRRKIKKTILKGIYQSNQIYDYESKRYVATISEKALYIQIRMVNYQQILEGKRKQIANFPISANLLQTKDFKAIKHSLNHQWRLQKLSHSQLIMGYKLLTILKKNSKKLQGKCNLIQCYQPEKLKELSFLDCVKSQSCNIKKLIDVFQSHLIFNYVHILNLIHKMRPQHLKYFLPDGYLFKNFKPKDKGYLTKSCLLNNINFLGTLKLQKIKANYNNIANIFLSKLYGINNQLTQQQDSTYFFYNLLVEEGNTRLTFQQFRQEQDKLYVVLSESQNMEQLFAKLNKFYQDRNHDWFEEICDQISKSKNPSQIFDQILECCQNLTSQQYLKSLNFTYQRLLTLTSDQFTQLLKFIQSMNKILNSFEDQDYNQVKLKIENMKKAYIISLILDNFNLTYSFNTVIYSIMLKPDDTQKCLNQILENYHINRVKQFQIKLNDKVYDLYQSLELRSLLQEGFQILNERQIEIIIFRKCLDFGKYRELKSIFTQLRLSVPEYDQTISDAMLRYLKLQKNISNIEDERKKFLEIINDIQQFKREKFIKCKKVMNLYKFIIESKETVDECLDLIQCNQLIFQIYRKSNNLDIPYIRLKKKLARAYDLQIYDNDFCKFMLELVQKIININMQRAQLILDDLLKNGNEIIQSEVAIIQLKLSKDGAKQNESFARLLKGSQSADIIQTLLRFHKQQQQQIQLPEKIDILSKQMIDIPLENSISIAKFEQEYKKYYNRNLPDDVFLDLLVKNPDEAFFILQRREPTETFELIKQLSLSTVIHSENLLTKYLQAIVGKINIILLLESDNELIQNLTQALVISRHLQIFNKQALFDRNSRKKQVIERLEQYELDNIIPELIYFKDLDLKDLKLQVFLKKLQSVNLNKYYINSEQQIKSYVKNQIKLNPAIIDLDVDLRYHFIIYEDIYGFTAKEKQIIKSFISQCILAINDNIVNYDRIYKQIIKKDFQFEVVKQDFEKIIEAENVFIICELAKYYYTKKEKIVFESYTTKMIKADKQKERNFWLNNPSTDSLVNMAKQQISVFESNKQKQEIY